MAPTNWIDRWLGINFYEDRCEAHPSKYKTIFCSTCMQENVCESCWRGTVDQHEDHQFLEVCRASRRTAVTVEDISEHYDVFNVQTYIINSKNVVYLNPNKGADVRRKFSFKCNSCNGKLIESKFEFCSIACKKKVVGAEGLVNIPTRRSQRGTIVLGRIISSHRKKPRKGIPVRSPLK